MSEQINCIGQMWWGWMWPMFWQVGVLVGLVWVIHLIIGKRVWPQVSYALWLLVLLKLVLPPSLAVSTSVTSALQPLAREAMRYQLPAGQASPAVHTKESRPAVPSLKDPLAAKTTVDTEALITVVPTGTAEAVQESSVKLCWQAYAVLGWLLGVFVLTGWLLMKFRRLRQTHLVQASVAEPPRWFRQLVADTAKKLRLRRLPEVILSRSVHSPAVFGALKPVLLMPAKKIDPCSRKEIEHVLLHELAHIKRGDLKVHACYLVLQIIYWFNPLLWLVRRQLRHLRELCCDATVARILREETDDYRETILETARRLLARPAETGLGLLGLFEDSSRLPVRLKWLEKKTWRYRGLRIAIIIAIVAVMSACVLPMAKAESIVVEGSEGTLPKASLATKGSKWGPEQATGEPDTYWAGDIPTAWASLTEDGQKEWLLLEYEKPVVPVRIDIYETFNPGAVNRVSVFAADGREVEAWSGTDPTPAGSERGVSEIPIRVNFETKRVKIYLDSPRVRGWNEIDAVALVDGSGQVQWAVHAKASSTFAEQTGRPCRAAVTRGRNWEPEQATGAPDTARAGDIPTAWASLTEDGQREWLLLEYEKPVVPVRIDIHETFNPGAVDQVSVFAADGREVAAWSGTDPTPVGSERGVSEIPIRVNFETKRVKIYLDSPRVRGWNEIDAVGLVDGSGQMQWASDAKASSTFAQQTRAPHRGSRRGRNWGPEQATGDPDTPDAGDIPTAWASLTQDGQNEWLLLEYDEPVVPARIDIHETFNPGAVNRVTVFTANGKEVEVWSGTDPTPVGSGRGVSKIPVKVDFKTEQVKIYLDSPRVRGWNEIDAVGLVDGSGRTQWASDAKASSTFAEQSRYSDTAARKGRNWGPEQATGDPDTPGAGDIPTAWASLTEDGQKEWLLLEYAEPVAAAGIKIYETYNPGAVNKVSVFTQDGEEVEVWAGKDPSPAGSGMGVSEISFRTDFKTKRVKIYIDSPSVRGWNEIDAVELIDTEGRAQWAVSAEASSTYAEHSRGRRSGRSRRTPENITDVINQELVPPNAVQIGYVDNTAEGRSSLGGSGHAVMFERPDTVRYIEAVQIVASRYGTPTPPKEDFHLYVLDEEQQILADSRYPYAMIERSGLRWYTLGTASIEVPKRFYIALSFNPHRTKGIYLGLDRNVEQSHSFTGLPNKGFGKVGESYDWMVRPYLSREGIHPR